MLSDSAPGSRPAGFALLLASGFVLVAAADTAPVIQSQPQATTALTAKSVTLRVAASGNNLAFQWRRSGTPIPGATSSSYTFTAAQADNGATFDVQVSNGAGTVTSSPATLTLGVPLTYAEKVSRVQSLPGFVALWDFVQRESPQGRFVANVPSSSPTNYPLEAWSVGKVYTGGGTSATYASIPVIATGTFGAAAWFDANNTNGAVFSVPRGVFHGTPLDIKGASSLSLVMWVLKPDTYSHGMAGIWQEGGCTNYESGKGEPGKRQWALFGGHPYGGNVVSLHVSNTGQGSFSSGEFARDISVSSVPINPATGLTAATPTANLVGYTWQVYGATYDRANGEVRSYVDGFFAPRTVTIYALNKTTGATSVLDSYFANQADAWTKKEFDPDRNADKDQGWLSEEVVEDNATLKATLRTYRYTKIMTVLMKATGGSTRYLWELSVNPYPFQKDFYAPQRPEDGAPFLIGGPITRYAPPPGFQGYTSGVAVYNQPLSAAQMASLASPQFLEPLAVGSLTAPLIGAQPASQSVVAGTSATFTVAASGQGLSYQWYRGATAIPGATSASYTTPATTLADQGALFQVAVRNAGGEVRSNQVRLTVTTPVSTNPALGRPALASSTEAETLSASAAFDGNAASTRWSSAFSDAVPDYHRHRL